MLAACPNCGVSLDPDRQAGDCRGCGFVYDRRMEVIGLRRGVVVVSAVAPIMLGFVIGVVMMPDRIRLFQWVLVCILFLVLIPGLLWLTVRYTGKVVIGPEGVHLIRRGPDPTCIPWIAIGSARPNRSPRGAVLLSPKGDLLFVLDGTYLGSPGSVSRFVRMVNERAAASSRQKDEASYDSLALPNTSGDAHVRKQS